MRRNWRTQKVRPIYIICLWAFVFFFVYSWLFWPFNVNNVKFTSPDETANFYFTRQFADQGKLSYTEPINEIVDGAVRPRSTRSIESAVVPASFLGMPVLYGLIGKMVGARGILLLTPLAAAVGIFFFYLFCREIFPRRVALMSTLLLSILPPYWYYASRGMFHNTLFVSLLIIGLYLFLKALKNKTGHHAYWIGSGIFFGLAIITRSSEIIWLVFVAAALIISGRRRIRWREIIIFMAAAVAIGLPLFYVNYQLFGSSFNFSYVPTGASGGSNTSMRSVVNRLAYLVLPFGIHPRIIGGAVWNYIILLFPWLGLPLLFGAVWILKNFIAKKASIIFYELKEYFCKRNKKQRIYYGIYLLVALWLIIYYGSFEFYEYRDKSEIILGSSYLRYWLPLFVFGLPLVIQVIFRIGYFFKKRNTRVIVTGGLLISIVLFSVITVLNDPLQGLFALREHIADSIEKNKATVLNTETDGIIIAGNADKVFFPERRVIARLPTGTEAKKILILHILERGPLYYYYNPLDTDAPSLLEFFEDQNILLVERIKFSKDGTVLYQLHY